MLYIVSPARLLSFNMFPQPVYDTRELCSIFSLANFITLNQTVE